MLAGGFYVLGMIASAAFFFRESYSFVGLVNMHASKTGLSSQGTSKGGGGLMAFVKHMLKWMFASAAFMLVYVLVALLVGTELVYTCDGASISLLV